MFEKVKEMALAYKFRRTIYTITGIVQEIANNRKITQEQLAILLDCEQKLNYRYAKLVSQQNLEQTPLVKTLRQEILALSEGKREQALLISYFRRLANNSTQTANNSINALKYLNVLLTVLSQELSDSQLETITTLVESLYEQT
jgi:hypothetical protein